MHLNESHEDDEDKLLVRSSDVKQLKKIPKNKKTYVPKTLKCQVWDKYIGKEKGFGPCYVCESTIDSKFFECGHIISEYHGGTTKLNNLRPICGVCNKSVGKKNMDFFKEKFFK